MDGQWNTAANWTDDIVPGAADDVLLDNLHGVNGSYTVALSAGSVIINSLTISPDIPNTITFLIPASNNSSTAFRAVGIGDAVVINNGAVFINASGAASGTPVSVTSTNFFRINNGGRYIHRTQRGHTDFLVSRLSTVAGTEKGIFEFDVPQTGYTVSVSNRTYGTLKLSSAVNYVGTGTSPLAIRGDFIIDAGASFTLTGIPAVILNGVSNQDIDIAGAIIGTVDLNLDNIAGASLLRNLVLPYRFTITTGNLRLGNYNITTPAVNQVGAAVNNHIVTNGLGELIITAVNAASVTFNIGINESSINPITISNGNGSGFGARVQEGIHPASIVFGNRAVNRTWSIHSSYSGAPVNIDFFYSAGDANPGFDYSANTELGQYISSNWNIPQSNIIPSGTYKVSTNSITSFNTQFIIGNAGAILPVDCFTSVSINREGLIKWTVTGANDIKYFEVERSSNSSPFIVLKKLYDHSYKDESPEYGYNVYRIKAVLLNGQAKYSKNVLQVEKGFAIRVVGNTIIIRRNDSRRIRFRLIDMQGRIIKQWDQDNIIITGLKPGVYLIQNEQVTERVLVGS